MGIVNLHEWSENASSLLEVDNMLKYCGAMKLNHFKSSKKSKFEIFSANSI